MMQVSLADFLGKDRIRIDYISDNRIPVLQAGENMKLNQKLDQS
jgi:hypothetical protein